MSSDAEVAIRATDAASEVIRRAYGGAAGRRAAYVTDGHLHFTGGIALCQAADCVVTNLAGQPVHTGAQGLVASSGPATHQELIDLVTRHRHD
ncbi:hypothetical protein [Amycolatopsis alba]|uniref:hypothetical protein n=1 Tax=Amycolatopsis alba TaxID=76020 RepID=UPI00037DB93F|nr:hypothetical protein [Amycolatopsis alba]